MKCVSNRCLISYAWDSDVYTALGSQAFPPAGPCHRPNLVMLTKNDGSVLFGEDQVVTADSSRYALTAEVPAVPEGHLGCSLTLPSHKVVDEGKTISKVPIDDWKGTARKVEATVPPVIRPSPSAGEGRQRKPCQGWQVRLCLLDQESGAHLSWAWKPLHDEMLETMQGLQVLEQVRRLLAVPASAVDPRLTAAGVAHSAGNIRGQCDNDADVTRAPQTVEAWRGRSVKGRAWWPPRAGLRG